MLAGIRPKTRLAHGRAHGRDKSSTEIMQHTALSLGTEKLKPLATTKHGRNSVYGRNKTVVCSTMLHETIPPVIEIQLRITLRALEQQKIVDEGLDRRIGEDAINLDQQVMAREMPIGHADTPT